MCKGPQQHEEASLGLLYTILVEPVAAAKVNKYEKKNVLCCESSFPSKSDLKKSEIWTFSVLNLILCRALCGIKCKNIVSHASKLQACTNNHLQNS